MFEYIWYDIRKNELFISRISPRALKKTERILGIRCAHWYLCLGELN